jgi:hypothetical protein
MPLAIALIIVAAVLAITLIGLIWAMIFLLPFYGYVAIVIYLVWRSHRKHAELSATVQREAERQRLFNEQEMRAWRRSMESEDRDGPKER